MHIPNMADIRQIWKSGLKQLEEVFKHHIQKMDSEFENKTSEYNTIKQELKDNHEFMIHLTKNMKMKME